MQVNVSVEDADGKPLDGGDWQIEVDVHPVADGEHDVRVRIRHDGDAAVDARVRIGTPVPATHFHWLIPACSTVTTAIQLASASIRATPRRT